MASGRRSAQLSLRISEEEMARLRSAAGTSGETVAEFVRAAVACRCGQEHSPNPEPATGERLTRSQRRVLAAVTQNAALGSVARVAQAAGLSWSAARRALEELSAAGIVRQTTSMQTWRRGVRERTIWTVDMASPAHQAMWTQAGRVKLPPRPPPEVHVGPLPGQFWSLFWNHPDPSKLRLPDDADYIANRLLNGPSALAALWASVRLTSDALRSCLPLRSTESHTRDLINNALAHRSIARDQTPIAAPRRIDGLNVGSLQDVAATKLKVIGDRGELRDYYDLMRIETDTGLMMETGLRLYAQRYGIELDHPGVAHIVRALGAFSDVAPHPWLADSTREAGRDDANFDAVSAYWRRRQPEAADWLTAHLSPTDRRGKREHPTHGPPRR